MQGCDASEEGAPRHPDAVNGKEDRKKRPPISLATVPEVPRPHEEARLQEPLLRAGTLACRAGLCIVIEAERATHPNTRLLYLRAERCLFREWVTRAPIRRTIATPLEERFVTKVLLPQTPGLVVGDRGSLRLECRRSRIQDPPKALRAVCGVSLLPLLSKIPKMKMAQTDSGSSLPQRYRCCSFVKVQTSL